MTCYGVNFMFTSLQMINYNRWKQTTADHRSESFLTQIQLAALCLIVWILMQPSQEITLTHRNNYIPHYALNSSAQDGNM